MEVQKTDATVTRWKRTASLSLELSGTFTANRFGIAGRVVQYGERPEGVPSLESDEALGHASAGPRGVPGVRCHRSPRARLMESHLRVVPWRFILIQTVASGGMAASIIYFARKGWWMVALSVIVWTSVSVLNSGEISFNYDDRGLRVELGGVKARTSRANVSTETLSEEDLNAIYTQRSILGALAIALIASGYAMFIRVISKELEQRTRLETEVSIAREIQQSLLPLTTHETGYAEVSGATVPATEVGGDFFDIVELSGPEVAVAIADVAGHGVGAGILAAMTKSAFRSQLQNNRVPVDALQNLNRTILEVSTAKLFVDVAYLLIDPSTGIMRYATAGHPPILVRTSSGNDIRELRTVNIGSRNEGRRHFHF